MKKFAIATAAAALALGALAAAPANAAGVKVGVLTCHVSSGWGFVFGSSKDLRCNYRPNRGVGEHYVGTVQKFGVDIGYTEGGELIWGVVAPTSDLKRGALEGGYGGVSASAAIGVGAGANALIGGLDKSIALQPLSVEGMKGVNVAAGIGAIDLKYTP
jgi:opacity protein-like surface antigen